MRPFVLPVLLALGMVSAPAFAAPCRNAKGQFGKCLEARKARARCKDTKGKFLNCGSPGAKPV